MRPSTPSGPLPATGKAVMRRRAAPIGISVIVSTGSVVLAGLFWSLPGRPMPVSVQTGSFLALARISTGAPSCVNTMLDAGHGLVTTSNADAGFFASNARA